MTGWGFIENESFDGTNCEIYIIVKNAKNKIQLYTPAIESGITGTAHIGAGKNLENCDFTALIDVSDFADGDYEIGVAIQYTFAKNKINRLANTFGDAYNFTVLGGVVTAWNGIEQ